MSAALTPLMPATEPAPLPLSVDMGDLVIEPLHMLLTALGAAVAAGIVAVGDLALVKLCHTVIADDVMDRVTTGTVRLRTARLAVRTVNLVAAGEYTAAVDALEAHATCSCEDCWEHALDQRDFPLCPGCVARAECDAPVVVDEALVIVDDAPAGAIDGDEARPGVVRCETAAQRFYSRLAAVTLPSEAVALWLELRDELDAGDLAAARLALDEHAGRVGRLGRPAQWIDRALMEFSRTAGAR